MHSVGTNDAGSIRAVIDTSTLAHAGLRRELQEQAALGQFVAIWSPWIVGELHRVLTWRWLERHRDFGHANWYGCSQASKVMMELLVRTFETVAPSPPYPDAWQGLTDPWDKPIWAAARASGAQYVISENTKDFPPPDGAGLRRWNGIEYVTGVAFLKLLGRDIPD